MFSYLYDILSWMYHADLSDYLWGYNCATNALTQPTLHDFYGICMLLSSIGIAAVYYLAINSPRFNHRSHWLLFMAIAVVANFVIGFYFTNEDLNNGSINQMMYSCDGNLTPQVLIEDCLMFGLSNAIFAAVFYFIASIGLKYASRNCKVVPF